MIDYWFLTDIALYALLMAAIFICMKGVLTFFHALSAMVSFYTLSPHTDVNIRSAGQSEVLAEYVVTRDRSIRIILFSTVAMVVIIFIRHLLEAVHAIL